MVGVEVVFPVMARFQKKDGTPSAAKVRGCISSHKFGWRRRWVMGPCLGCGLDSAGQDEQGRFLWRMADGTVYLENKVPACPTPVPKVPRGQRRASEFDDL